MGRRTNPYIQTLKGRAAVGALRLLGLLPFRLNRALATALGGLLARLSTEAREVTRINLSLCLPDHPDREALVRESLVESVKNTFEIARFWSKPEDGLQRVVSEQGDGPLREAVANKEPILILAPHLGCWEVLNFWLAREFGLHAMFAPSGLPELDALVKQGREHFGTTMYPATARGVAGLVRAMRKGALTAILPDQVADRRSGRFAPFFGQPAYTGTLSCKLVKQTNARVFMAWARRLPGDEGFEIRVRPADPDIHDEDLDHALKAMNRSIEALILEDPSQYLWSYKRFRRQPPGGTLPY
ncbi:MAG TPA: lipid A biosynthesis acyltransferase [Alcanivorax sp.]|jgi:Kdo2-lipid IVA lauroyltransferase/acyltransferase|uniref:Lipid A biosynthesis lauroyl acyltransferase n=1 Tax=Alloalcanivorax venustensis ISO4 TaxID=1177184 RepID=A0ABS0AI90_9GAMM|nr:lysophospholipid acyltransferase family protein [Alloalcanivorax venustensis]MCH2553210.1 lysophospholipid acyltransferase family protein [Alcanivorax sp.]MCH9784652.1 lysophospholipid acyltransferase family protein [Gammaproteobacteria bacterium]MEC8879780.1 lysophospholipid acyltransferase family protein [Pseudomonadota bacterium]MBF5053649.1 lipid A biosynthesis lauroyl acyltransferase [Alloalcanivorax venustensis ISO4]HAR61406.1 lipid A biosynthesis acyltransferase [Alcanivorax sp.]|tara:strand:+ start:8916 stop:9818 length:903 start_codon:yes stop_codon:yes gene_type:complete